MPRAPAHRRQVKPVNHLNDEPRQRSLRKPVIHRRRQKEPSLAVNRAENCSKACHPARKKGRINAKILPNPAKSDRLLDIRFRALLDYGQHFLEITGREQFATGPADGIAPGAVPLPPLWVLAIDVDRSVAGAGGNPALVPPPVRGYDLLLSLWNLGLRLHLTSCPDERQGREVRSLARRQLKCFSFSRLPIVFPIQGCWEDQS